MGQRAAAIIIKNGKILLIRRIKEGREYFVFPGGGVEEKEKIEEAVIREIKEELNLDISIEKLLFQIENQGRQEFYFLVRDFSGILKLGGEEKEIMNESNQYHPLWIKLKEIKNLSNLYPEKAKIKVGKLILQWFEFAHHK